VQGVVNLFCAIAIAACAHPHSDARNGWGQLGKAGFTHCIERTNV
jgi:hypothetical protein